MVSAYRPLNDFARTTTRRLGKANSSVLSLVPGVGNVTTPMSWLNKGKPMAAAASVAGGSLGAVGIDSVGQALKTRNRVLRQGGGLKKSTFALTRGFASGLKKNRRDIVDAATGGGMTLGANLNSAVKKSALGQTKVGKLLTKDISSPLVSKLQPRKMLRRATGGLFSESTLFLCDF